MSTTTQPDRGLTDRSSASTADMAVEGCPKLEDRHIETAETAHSRDAEPLPEDKKHDQLEEKAKLAENRQEALLDEAIEETFPSSDPISPKHIT